MPLEVGFIGLGAMGSAMTARLLAAGYRVTGYDVRAEAVKALQAHGGFGVGSAAEAAKGADVLVLMVVNADQAEQALFVDGALEALPKGATVVVMATCAPDRVAAMAAAVTKSGRDFIDAPVSGGVAGAEAGTLTIMAAGPKGTVEKQRPLLTAMGTNLFHLGEVAGQGAAMKVVNQLLCGVQIASAAEGLAFAERHGIDARLALQILSGSAASSWMLKDRGPRMVGDDARVTSTVEIFVKDLDLVLDAGHAARMGLPLAAAAHQRFLDASGMGLGAKDDSQVIETYRQPGGKRRS